ncbi:hypothetical protein BS78_06G029100 [Paspalum vaginatum]|nr:hypothetical protein BS78_06G029100 [Paspalum vaginatum]
MGILLRVGHSVSFGGGFGWDSGGGGGALWRAALGPFIRAGRGEMMVWGGGKRRNSCAGRGRGEKQLRSGSPPVRGGLAGGGGCGAGADPTAGGICLPCARGGLGVVPGELRKVSGVGESGRVRGAKGRGGHLERGKLTVVGRSAVEGSGEPRAGPGVAMGGAGRSGVGVRRSAGARERGRGKHWGGTRCGSASRRGARGSGVCRLIRLERPRRGGGERDGLQEGVWWAGPGGFLWWLLVW